MEIIKLPSAIEKERKHIRSIHLKKNKSAYKILKDILVPQEMKLSQFRKWYHAVLTTDEKEILISIGLNPWAVEGLKYVGDCRRLKIKLVDIIQDDK